MSASGVNFSGLGSGIDTESIVSQLLAVQRRPIQKLQTRQAQIQQQRVALTQFSAAVSGLQSAASALDSALTYQTVKSSSSNEDAVKISVSSSAKPGSYTLQVNQLAQAHRIASATLSTQSDPLGVSGEIVINGQAISISSNDSLQNVASEINSAQVGVQASIIQKDDDQFVLTLTSSRTGADNTISLADSNGGSILRTTLGLITSSTSIAHAVTNGAQSRLFDDSATSVGSQLGLTSPPAGSITIDGTSVALDFGVDSLSGIVSKINSANITGVTASIVNEEDPVSGDTKVRLKIVGASTPTFTDSSNLLTNLGILKNGISDQIASGQDSSFTLNGLSLTRSSNSVADAISGVTLNLESDTGAPTSTVEVTSDTDAIAKQITTFTNAFNYAVQTLSDAAQFDPDTLASGPLFGDNNTQNVINSLSTIFADSIDGLTGSIAVLGDVGITLDGFGKLQVNEATLKEKLTDNLDEVARVFRGVGVGDNNTVQYISSTSKTKASTSSGYAVNVTQLATQASSLAGTAHTADDNTSSETLTFTGSQFGTNGHTLLIPSNSTLADIVSLINADDTLNDYLTASSESGKLKITAKAFGSAGSFGISSNQGAANNNSGIGTTAVSATGLDVAGTINGEAATGKGQFLTGDANNATTEGLQLRITSLVTGSLGSLVFTKGYANRIVEQAKDATDAFEGSLSLFGKQLGDDTQSLTDEITAIDTRLKEEETRLRLRFIQMDSAVARIKGSASALANLLPTN